MSPEALPGQTLPSPWREFLDEVDELLSAPVRIECLGGFVITVCYALPRPTADIDYISVLPQGEEHHLQTVAGPQSRLARKHRVWIHNVGVVNVPEDYEQRLLAMFPQHFRYLRLLALDPHDLALSKLERNSPKDREDVEYLAKRIPLDPAVLRERYEKELRPYLVNLDRHDGTIALWLEAYFPRS